MKPRDNNGPSYEKRDLHGIEKNTKRHKTLALRTSKPVVLNFCPSGYQQCPVAGVSGESECLDTTSELTSCGGCTSAGAGTDCSKIPHVAPDSSSCYGGFCSGTLVGLCKEDASLILIGVSLVFACEKGYKPSDDGRSCVPA